MSRTTRRVYTYYVSPTAGEFDSTRDKKKWYKPGSGFKLSRRRQRRNVSNQALREGRDTPVEKQCDVWDWN